MAPVITTGVPKKDSSFASNTVYPRLELRTFLEDKDVTNLYIQATARMQATDEKDPTSWFQLAAIHGRPYQAWDNVGENKVLEEGRTGGYCTHSSVLFPSWHRPYMALFEQVMSKHAFEIANEFKGEDKERYLAAAQRFRIPYWDWAFNSELPRIVAFDEKVTIQTPRGAKVIDNPLSGYKFRDPRSSKHWHSGLEDGEKWLRWGSTVRFPTRDGAPVLVQTTWEEGGEKMFGLKAVFPKEDATKSQPVKMQQELGSRHEILRDKVYMLLTQTTKYGAFSNDSYDRGGQDPVSYNNIESIHNDIHGYAGWDGHMGEVDYAAYDPVFWMHHANVDRLFALWQALNPNAWIDRQENDSGTWTVKRGTPEDSKTPLTPFRKSDTVFWNSDDVRETETFNYTYPQLKRWKGLDSKTKMDNVHAHINSLYGSPVVRRLIDAYYEEGGKALIPKSDQLTSKPRASDEPKVIFREDDYGPCTVKPGDRLHYHEWVANIEVKKYEVKSSFIVHVFIGEPNANSSNWNSDPHLVGSQVIFANNPDSTGCANCITHAEDGLKVTGCVPLTGWLGERIREKNLQLEPAVIKPYLERNLCWRWQKLIPEEADVALESLRLYVGTTPVYIPKPGTGLNEFPTLDPKVGKENVKD